MVAASVSSVKDAVPAAVPGRQKATVRWAQRTVASRPPNSCSIVKVDEDINTKCSGCVRNSSQRTNFTGGTESCGSRKRWPIAPRYHSLDLSNVASRRDRLTVEMDKNILTHDPCDSVPS